MCAFFQLDVVHLFSSLKKINFYVISEHASQHGTMRNNKYAVPDFTK